MVFNKELKAANQQAKQSNFFCKVNKDSDIGYWEIDYVNQTANFRFLKNQRLPKGIDIVDHIDDSYDIIQFLEEGLFMHTKVIIPNKKVIFSDRVFCDMPYCDGHAIIRFDPNEKRCQNHMGFKF